MTDILIAVIHIAVPAAAVLAVLSVAYLWYLYRETPEPRSWLFQALYREDGVVAVVGLYYAYLAAGRYIPALPSLSNPWSGIVFGLTVIVLLAPPIAHAVSIWRARRSAP